MSRRADSFRLEIQVQPRARQTRIVGWHGMALKLQVNAPPVDGAANQAVIALLAEVLGLPRSKLQVVRGATGRHKWIEVDAPEAACRLALEAATAFVDKKMTRD